MHYRLEESMDSQNINTKHQSLSGPLQMQDKIIPEATRIMLSLPGKSTRPLKKRRFVSIESEDAVVSKPPKNSSAKSQKKKIKRARRSKKQDVGIVSPLPPSSPTTVMVKSVTWNDRAGNLVHMQPDPTQIFPNFNQFDLWYTRENYKDFLLDRLKTIDSYRFMTANNINDDDSSGHCIRGLEIFQDETTIEHFQSKRKLYYSTIKMEQIRQALLGIKDPERFRVLVEPQSDLNLHWAQELAAQDEQEVYPFHTYYAANDHRNISASSFSDMQRLNNLMKSIYGSSDPPRDTSQSTSNTHSPNKVSSFQPVAKSRSASMVSDGFSTSSSEANTTGQSLLFDDIIRQLQERSMRRLMGIYQKKNGEGTEGVSETNALFKFARRDSLLGIRDSAARENANAVVPTVPAETAPSPHEQLVEILQRRRILQDQQQQQQKQQQHVASSEDTTFSLEEQTVEMQHRRQLLQDHLQHQQQHVASSDDTNPSLREQVMEMLQRRLLLEDQQQQQQHFPSILGVLGQGIGCDSSKKSNDAGSMMEFVLLQQHQRQQKHQNRMQLAVMAMNATRFPIRRDTLSHVHTNTTHSEAAASINHPSLPWNVTSMA